MAINIDKTIEHNFLDVLYHVKGVLLFIVKNHHICFQIGTVRICLTS